MLRTQAALTRLKSLVFLSGRIKQIGGLTRGRRPNSFVRPAKPYV